MAPPRVYADFHNADDRGRVRLNCVGTVKDLARQQVELRDGVVLTLYADDADAQGRPDDLEAIGVVEYSGAESCWVARIDWAQVRHASDPRRPPSPPSDVGTLRTGEAV